MSSPHELARGRKQTRGLIEFAQQRGWEFARTSGDHLKFAKPGLPLIYTAATSSDYRAERNACAQLRRAGRQDNAQGGSYDG